MLRFFWTLLGRMQERLARWDCTESPGPIDPLDHPAIRGMSQRQIADLPFQPLAAMR